MQVQISLSSNCSRCWEEVGRQKEVGRKNRNTVPVAEYSEKAATEIAPRDVEVALSKIRGTQKFTVAHVTIGWAANAYHFRDPLDFLGHDGGAGLAAGPGLTVV